MRNLKNKSDARRRIFSESSYLRYPTEHAKSKMEEMLSAFDSVQSEREAALWKSIAPCLYRETDPYTLAEKKELSSAIASLLDTLPEKERTVLFLIYWKNLTLEKCGCRLGVSGARARQIEQAALRHLRKGKYWRIILRSFFL